MHRASREGESTRRGNDKEALSPLDRAKGGGIQDGALHVWINTAQSLDQGLKLGARAKGGHVLQDEPGGPLCVGVNEGNSKEVSAGGSALSEGFSQCTKGLAGHAGEEYVDGGQGGHVNGGQGGHVNGGQGGHVNGGQGGHANGGQVVLDQNVRANVLLNEAARKGVHVGRKDLPNRAEGAQGKEF